MVDDAGTLHRAVALVVPPMARHRLLATAGLRTFFVEPHCAFADQLRERCGAGVTVAADLGGLDEDDVRRATARPSSELDPRLLAAMDTRVDQRVSMPALAAGVGLSPQRLRALAREQLGMPLGRWQVWQRLGRAAAALRAGESLAGAAIAGGFADQAHFTRQLREMMGLTPSAVLPALRSSPAARDVDRDRAGDR
ncbi:helix-turn-helix domain-containing protein [Actinokineospora sp. NBRC 105648]|uniref:helix-turn-helix domain-containing protein n=1 Tax=Actinokineospora sp. NBRC 105648 TaxID=3032206 RepID=UPI0025565650|nr:helix-turn-helix domain-containing protein [Actinokineospora sp. NBRC 105648]